MRLSTQNCVVAVLAFLALGGSAYSVKAQGLGDVARKEEERRKDVKAPAKVYTNKDLGSVPDAPSGTFSSPAASGAASTEAPKDTTSKKDTTSVKKDTTSVKSDDAKDKSGPTKDQAYWSGRKKDLQTKLDSDQTLADALQSRINALNTDFVNRDDPSTRRHRPRPPEGEQRNRSPQKTFRTPRRPSQISTKPARLASRLAGCGDPARAPSPPILLVEDKDSLRVMLRHALRPGHPSSRRATSLKPWQPWRACVRMVLSDLRLPIGGGFSVLRAAKDVDRDAGHRDDRSATSGRRVRDARRRAGFSR